MPVNLLVYSDGSCGPPPDLVAAYGYIVKKDSGEILTTGSGRVGADASDAVGEYEGLYQAMLYIAQHHPRAHVVFHGDSTMVIRQMRGEAKMYKGKYLRYGRKTQALAAPFIERGLWTFRWIPRGLNTEADDLAQFHRY